MSASTTTGLTYDDLSRLPDDDGLRRELIDGELFVSPSPAFRHQDVVAALVVAFRPHLTERGGVVVPAPMDVVFGTASAVQPDVLALGPKRRDELSGDRFVDLVPDLVVEVSSPPTRRLDLVKKRRLYEREGVPEYWFVDLEAEVVDVHRLDDTGHYGDVLTLGPDDRLTSLVTPDLEISVADVLARP